MHDPLKAPAVDAEELEARMFLRAEVAGEHGRQMVAFVRREVIRLFDRIDQGWVEDVSVMSVGEGTYAYVPDDGLRMVSY